MLVVTLSIPQTTSELWLDFVLVSHCSYSYNSQDETSEQFIGEWMEKRGNRDQIVLATKASLLKLNRLGGC